MWFPVDSGMVNLERVAFIEVTDELEIEFFNDHRAQLTSTSFDSEEQLRQYLEKLKAELAYPVTATERERLPSEEKEPLLEPAGEGPSEDS